jgi:hypothetical protein
VGYTLAAELAETAALERGFQSKLLRQIVLQEAIKSCFPLE